MTVIRQPRNISVHKPFRFLPLPIFTLAASGLAALGASSAPSAAEMSVAASPETERRQNPGTLDEVIAGLYAGVSGPAERQRNWTAFEQLFVPGARIGVTRVTENGGLAVQLMGVKQFGALNDRMFSGRGFFESEIHREQTGFGGVLHVWSAYEARRAPGEAPYARGANSLQLVRTPEGWRIASLTWDQERHGQPLADRFPVPARTEGVRP
jgi:hypothetical protein